MNNLDDWEFIHIKDISSHSLPEYKNKAWLGIISSMFVQYQSQLLSASNDKDNTSLTKDNGVYIDKLTGAIVLKYQIKARIDDPSSFEIFPTIIHSLIVHATNATVMEGLLDSMYHNLDLLETDEVWSDVTINGTTLGYKGEKLEIPHMSNLPGTLFEGVSSWRTFCNNFKEYLLENKEHLIKDDTGLTYGPIRGDLQEVLGSVRKIVSKWYYSHMLSGKEKLMDHGAQLCHDLDIVLPSASGYDTCSSIAGLIADSLTSGGSSGRTSFLNKEQIKAIEDIIEEAKKNGHDALQRYVFEAERFNEEKTNHSKYDGYGKHDEKWYSVYGGNDGWYAAFLNSLYAAHIKAKEENSTIFSRINREIGETHPWDLSIDQKTTLFSGEYQFPFFRSLNRFGTTEQFLNETMAWFGPYSPKNFTNPINVARNAWEKGVREPDAYACMGSAILWIHMPYRGSIKFTSDGEGAIVLELDLAFGNINSENSSLDPLKDYKSKFAK